MKTPLPDIASATRAYERWLGERLTLLPADLRKKHAAMAEDPFTFLRATYYRWAQAWPERCPDEARAPAVLAIGDLHVENFGLWRDAEGRLVWGVNDFDEAARLPYTSDLVRLATSVRLAHEAAELEVPMRKACACLLEGYRNALAAGGRPIVLTEYHRWLHDLARAGARDPREYWEKLQAIPAWRGSVPPAAHRVLTAAFPGAAGAARLVHRASGVGSLGRERLALIGPWRGGLVAREVKALTVSATHWAHESRGPGSIVYPELLRTAVRCPDPMVAVRGGWVVRRLAPDNSRIELCSLPRERHEARMLYEMGWETGNIHLGTPRAITAIRRDLARRPKHWLERASRVMEEATIEDWRAWSESRR